MWTIEDVSRYTGVIVLTYIDQDFSISCINVYEDKKFCTNVYIQLLNRENMRLLINSYKYN
jgi:hypothetical protein